MIRIRGDVLKLAREYRGMTKTELAKESKVSSGTISKIESRLFPHVEEPVFERLSKALDFPQAFFQTAYSIPTTVIW